MVNTRYPLIIGVLSAFALCIFSNHANAYVVEQTSQGAELHWAQTPAFAINNAGSDDLAGSEFQTIRDSFGVWQSVSGADLVFTDNGTTALGYSSVLCGGDVCNDFESIVTWAEFGWQDSVSAIGLTYTIFYVESGEIIEADITLNGEDYTWTNGNTGVQTDVMNITVHEVGHYIGFGHSSDSNATMFASAQLGETKKRDLNSDDIAGMEYLYGDGTGGGGTGNDGCCGGVATILAPLLLLGLLVGPRRRRKDVVKTVAVIAVGAIAAMLVVQNVSAATLQAVPLEGLTEEAEAIVTGTVTKVEATVDPQAGIVTFIEVEVSDSLKGDAPETVVFMEPGGEPDGLEIGLRVSGTPKYQTGEEVLVFLHEGKGQYAGYLRTVALVQGKFRLERADDGRMFAVRDLSGVALMRFNADGVLEHIEPFDPSIPEALSLDELTEAIEAATK